MKHFVVTIASDRGVIRSNEQADSWQAAVENALSRHDATVQDFLGVEERAE